MRSYRQYDHLGGGAELRKRLYDWLTYSVITVMLLTTIVSIIVLIGQIVIG
jgi:hypothetical protein